MIKTIALDDEPPALEVIRSFCEKTDFLNLHKAFTQTSEASKYLEKYPVDLVFLDINMPRVSGLEFAKNIPEKTMVIFTTAYSEFAIEGFNLNAVDYLLKPYTYKRFLQAAEKAKAFHSFLYQSESVRQDFVVLRVDYSLVKVHFEDILFIEGLDDYIKIYLKDQKPVVVRMTMKALHDKLPQTEFIRVHRSFIVPFRKIEAVRSKIIYINGDEIPIGASYIEDFFSKFNK